MPTNDFTSSTTVRADLRFASAGSSSAAVTFTVNADVECWTLHVELTSAQLQTLRTAGVILNLVVSRTGNPGISATSSGPFYTLVGLPLSTDEMSQGYAACRYPNIPSEEPNVPGSWTARLESSGDFGGIDVTAIPIWLTMRQLAIPASRPANASDTYSLPLQFVLVSDRSSTSECAALLRAAIDYFTTTLMPQVGMGVTIAHDTKIVRNSISYTSDFYSADLQSLISSCQNPDMVTVFVIQNIAIQAVGESAVGIAMLPGPQGFTCAHSAVIVRITPAATWENWQKIGRRIAHELGHYLGLVHPSACLDSSVTSGAIAVCRAALGNAVDPNAPKINGNLMYTSNPGPRWSQSQAYQLKRSPAVIHTVAMPRTRITKLRVWVHTGGGFRSIGDSFRGDASGTDDNVYFSLTKSSFLLKTNEVSSNWNDFEANDSAWYQLDPGDNLFREDVNGFEIRKSYDYGTHAGIFGDDHWHLQGLQVEINDIVVYSNDSIDTWLVNDDSGVSTFSALIPPPGAGFAANALTDPAPAPPSYVTPPFISSPVALRFDPAQSPDVGFAQWCASWPSANPTVTLQAWICPEDLTSHQAIVSFGDGGAGTMTVFLRIMGGNYEFGIVGTGGPVVASASAPAGDLHRWIHLCGSYDGASMMIHRNGDTMASISSAQGVPAVTGGLSLGRYCFGAPFAFNGLLRNVSVWTTPRTAAQEQKDLFFIDTTESGIMSYWPLDEGDGTQANDAAPADLDLSISNAAWDIPPLAVPNTLFLPASSTASAFVTIAPAAKLAGGWSAGMAACAWIRIADDADVSTGTRVVFATADVSLGITNGNYECVFPGGSLSVAVAPGDAGHWVHLGMSCDPARGYTLLRNGFEIGTQTGPAFAPPADGKWYIGGSPTAAAPPYALEVRMLALFQGPLSVARLRFAYAGLSGDTPPASSAADGLVALWPLDDGAGSVIADVIPDTPGSPAADGTFDPALLGWSVSDPFPRFLFVDSGVTISSAVNSIADASESNPYTIFVGAGNFNEQVMLRPWVSLVGSGIALTNINLVASPNLSIPGTIVLEGSNSVRQLTAVTDGSGSPWGSTLTAIAVLGADGRYNVENVHLLAANYTGQGVNINVLSTNAVGNLVPVTLFMRQCISDAGSATGMNISIYMAALDARECTFNGGLWGVIDANTESQCKFEGCALNAQGANSSCLVVDSSSSVTATHCTIVGFTDGNGKVTILP